MKLALSIPYDFNHSFSRTLRLRPKTIAFTFSFRRRTKQQHPVPAQCQLSATFSRNPDTHWLDTSIASKSALSVTNSGLPVRISLTNGPTIHDIPNTEQRICRFSFHSSVCCPLHCDEFSLNSAKFGAIGADSVAMETSVTWIAGRIWQTCLNVKEYYATKSGN